MAMPSTSSFQGVYFFCVCVWAFGSLLQPSITRSSQLLSGSLLLLHLIDTKKEQFLKSQTPRCPVDNDVLTSKKEVSGPYSYRSNWSNKLGIVQYLPKPSE